MITNKHTTVVAQYYLDLLPTPGREQISVHQTDLDFDLEKGRCSMMLTLDCHAIHTHAVTLA